MHRAGFILAKRQPIPRFPDFSFIQYFFCGRIDQRNGLPAMTVVGDGHEFPEGETTRFIGKSPNGSDFPAGLNDQPFGSMTR